MGRKPVPQPLALGGSVRSSDDSRAAETVPNSPKRLPPDPASPRSPRSPRSPFRLGQKKSESTGVPLQLADVLHQPRSSQEQQGQLQQQQRQQQHRPHHHHHYHHQEERKPPERQLPQIRQPPAEQRPPIDVRDLPPPSPSGGAADQQQQLGHRHPRRDEDKASKSGFFFHFGKTPKPSDRPVAHQHSASRAETMSRDPNQPAPENQASKHLAESSQQEPAVPSIITPLPSRSEVSLASSTDHESSGHHSGSSKKSKPKPKPFNLLARTKSVRDRDNKDSLPKEYATTLAKIVEPERSLAPVPLKTAPLQAHDRSFREMMSSAVRNHSAERSQSRDGGKVRDQESNPLRGIPASLREASGSAFFNNLKNSKAAGIITNRLFGGGAKADPPAPKEPVVDDENYVLKVINLPLVEQTRLTRISKRLEDSRDKTEFWMPAFPWRAIDYLNYKGSDVEGLYRVPGSGPQIKKWQRRFDEELDVDLFEQTDLYDINIIGSMLKAWLRELPDELFPKEAQERIARECAGAEKVPQMLVDELSNLPPFNYYLLFAITCHLSLLLAHSEKNKMDYRNLCICFQPCMKIDSFCFKFLVCDWRDCWKGCKNEAKYIEEEYALFNEPPPKAAIDKRLNGSSTSEQRTQEERSASSSGSNKNPNQGASDQKERLKKALPESESAETSSTVSTTLTVSSEQTPPRKSGDLRPLSPIKPLSPLNF